MVYESAVEKEELNDSDDDPRGIAVGNRFNAVIAALYCNGRIEYTAGTSVSTMHIAQAAAVNIIIIIILTT